MKKDFCPLLGNIPYIKNLHSADDLYLNAIKRARGLWSKDNAELRHPDGYVMESMCFTEKDTEKAKRLFNAWRELRHDDLLTFMALISSAEESGRDSYIEDIMQRFKIKTGAIEEFNVSEVLSIIIIYEAIESLEQLKKTGKGDALSLELLSVLENYNPDVMRGKKVKAGCSNAGAGRALQIMEERHPVWEDWQKRANEIWKRNPCLSKLETAKKILKTLQGDPDYFSPLPTISTIRQRIKKS